jgi:putative membrane protein
MIKIFIKLALNTFTLLIVSYLVPGFYFVDLWTTIVTAVVIGVVNTFIKPVLQIVALPISILTFGIAAFLINVFLLWGVSFIVPGFEIESFMTAVIGSLVLSLVTIFLHKLSENKT